MISNKWARGSLSIIHNEVVLVVSMVVQMDMNEKTMIDSDEEGSK